MPKHVRALTERLAEAFCKLMRKKTARKELQFLDWKQHEIPDQAHVRTIPNSLFKPQQKSIF